MQLYQLALIMSVLAIALVAILVLILRSLRKPDRTAGRAERARERLRLPRFKLPVRTPEPEPAEPETPHERRRTLQSVSAAEERDMQTNGSTFSEEVFSKLEEAFEAYQRENISLETYSALIASEQQAVERRTHELRVEIVGREPSPEQAADLADAESAREAVRWCIDWAYELARGQKAATG